MLCFFALSIAYADGLSVISISISAFINLLSIALIIDWKFEPLPEASMPSLKILSSLFIILFLYEIFLLTP